MRQILFVDDEPRILDGLKRMLRPMREEWEMRFAQGGEAALTELAGWSADVVITDMRMPLMDGATLLEQVATRWPGVIRMVLSGQTDDDAAVRAVPVAHQFLMKPCDGQVLRGIIERACSLRDLLDNPGLRQAVGTIDALPPAPATYVALGRALQEPAASVEDIAAIIERDGALTAKLLQLVNSAFFGMPREVTSIAQGVALLGAGRIRSLTLAHEVFAGGRWGSPAGLSLEAEQNHSVEVAALARQLVAPVTQADTALAAGLLHDVGKLILGGRHPGQFQVDLGRSRAAGRPLHEIERERNGLSHAEVGAYLLGLWGLPHSVVEAVANHHAPDRIPEAGRQITAAVHLADALIHEGRGGGPVPLSDAAVTALGGPGRMEGWRELAARVVSP